MKSDDAHVAPETAAVRADSPGPLIGVLTPVYNGQRYLAESVESVLKQTYTNWRLVIVDNQSRDRTVEIAEAYARKDRRISLVRADTFVDVAENHNRALTHLPSGATYCKFVHADDVLFPDCLAEMARLAETYPTVGVVAAYRLDGEKVNLDGLPFPSTVVPGREVSRATLMGRLYVFGSPSSVMFRSALIRKHGFDAKRFPYHSDSSACFEILRESDLGFVHQVLTYSRRHLEGQTPRSQRFNSYLAEQIVALDRYGHVASSFFSGASFVITLPSAVAVFAWVATIWTGRPVVTTAFLYFASFIAMFVIGGVSGVMTASVAADLQLHDTYFVVAHIHYVLIGINLFGVLGALYFWFPKMTGRLLGERLGRWNFWIVFLGFNLAFLPMHWTGLLGMPRRIYTYPEELGWTTVNLITTIGAFVLAVGILLLLINVLVSLKRGQPAGPNPWDAPTLEWATSSPPPPYNFPVIPVVASRHPLWEDRLHEGSGRSSVRRGLVLDDGKETIATTVLDAEPNVIVKMPEDTPMPFLTTLAMTAGFAGLLLHWWWLALGGGAATLLGLIVWLWPRRALAQKARPAHG